MGFVDKLRIGKNLRALRAAKSVAPETLNEAKQALVSIGPAALGPLLECLTHREAREPAREILAEILNDESLSDFVEALASPDRTIQTEIAGVLRGSRKFNPMALISFLSRSDIPKSHLESVLVARAEDLNPRSLVEILPDFERDARTVVYRLLEETCDSSIAGDLAKLMTHKEWWIRLHMAKLLSLIPGDISREALTNALGDRNRSVRLQSVKGLEKLEARESVPPLIKVLRDGDLTVQAAAIDALVHIGDATAVPHLVDVLKDESEQARRGAVEVLNEVADAEAIQDLVHSLRDADWWVRVRSADALGTIGGEKVVDAILGLMGDDDVHIRRYAVEILNTVPDQRSVESLIVALKDDDWWVRERSIDALGRAGDPRALEPLVNLMLEDEEAAVLCCRALGTLGDPAAVDILIAALSDDPGDELGKEAREALKLIARSPDMESETRSRLDEALRGQGIKIEKTRLRPMTVRMTSEKEDDPSVAINPLEQEEKQPAKSLAQRFSEIRGGPEAGRSNSQDDTRVSPKPRPTPEVRPEDIEAGSVLLDRYKVLRKIGSGGFSTVFLVEDNAINDELIVKILSPHLSADENMGKRFVQELKLARRISHKNVIRIHDLLQIGVARGISMEYFPGRDLGEVLDECRKLPSGRCVAIARQICEGLAAAHDAGVIHRDIKPANVLVGEGDEVKIVDFGLANVTQEAENRLTRTGHLVGTPHYMAPESIRGEEVGDQSDLYSFGVMMYEMLTGKLPYDGDNPMNVLFRHLDGDAPPVHEIEKSVDEVLSRVVMRAMALRPADRPATAMDLFRELSEVGV